MLLWGGLRAARGETKLGGIPNSLNYCVIFYIIHITNKCGRGLHTNWRGESLLPMVYVIVTNIHNWTVNTRKAF
jgi:hypothetical protein